MSPNISRRELIAWLAAGAGAAATGSTVLLNNGQSTSPSAPSTSTTPPPMTSAGGAPLAPASGATAPEQATSIENDRLLVVVEMPGGNDGLSMAVPHGDGAYYDLRSQTAIAPADVLDLDGTIGLHPNLVNLHQRGVTLVEGVGSSQPDGSHFEMQQRWWAGSSSTASSSTGWIGRLSDVLTDGTGSGAAGALSVGSGAHPIIASATGSTVSMPSADALWAVAGADTDDAMRTAYQRALRSFSTGDGLLAPTLRNGLDFADRMIESGLGDDDAEELGYEGWGLGRSLQFAAAVFAGGMGVRVIHVQTEGDFDTHEGHAWKHPELMRELDANLGAFHADLDARGLGDRVMVMTTSEFGRTATENGSGGLDHGTASTMLLSGPGTNRRLGEAPSLTDLDDNDDVKASVPFEAYLGGVVEGWLGVPAAEVFDREISPLDVV